MLVTAKNDDTNEQVCQFHTATMRIDCQFHDPEVTVIVAVTSK